MELSDSIEIESRAIKFGKNVREINRQYEQNNNADLDNGVVNEQLQSLEAKQNLNISVDSLPEMIDDSSSDDSLAKEFNQ